MDDPTTITEYYQAALSVTAQASKIVKAGFDKVKKISTKAGPWDVVTEYDKEVEEFVIGSLSESFPSHKFIGEETTEVKDVLGEEPTWIIDPIDGTNNYALGYPESAVSVGLSLGGRVVVGVVANPMKALTYSAYLGGGAFLNGSPLRATRTKALGEACVGYEVSLARVEAIREPVMKRLYALTSRARGIRSVGCAALSLCYVAEGVWDAYHVDFLYPWDYAAGSLIVQEAGGTVLDSKGGEFHVMNRSIVATGTGELATEILECIREADGNNNLQDKFTCSLE